MNNIHILSTDKSSRLILQGSELLLSKYMEINEGFSEFNQHLFITNDEEIKEGDWVYHPDVSQEYTKVNLLKEGDERYTKGQHVAQGVYKHKPTTNEWYKKERKIIATSDQDLIADGIQAIDDEFLEWFVKNPSCEEVKVVKGKILNQGSYITGNIVTKVHYEIIIPREELKQETLEEAAENFWLNDDSMTNNDRISYVNGFRQGAKWQQEFNDTSKVTRVEVIQHSPPYNGRAYTNYNAKDVEIQFQDDGRTLKIFLK